MLGKRHSVGAIVLLVVILLISVAVVQAQETSGRDTVEERELLAKLEAISPEAVPVFVKATADMDASNFESARAGYEEVLDLAPEFPDAMRRLSYVQVALGDADAGIALARRALELQGGSYNESALARALLAQGSPASEAEAFLLAQSAAASEPGEYFNHIILAEAALHVEEPAALRQASAAALALEPDSPLSHYYAGVAAAVDENWVDAERAFLRAEELGYPSENIQRILDDGISAHARNARMIRWGLYLLAGWLGGLVLLFLLGSALSMMTLSGLKRKQGDDRLDATGLERSIRSLYRAVIVLASAYYYISMPILILLVIVVFGGVAYLFLNVSGGRIPTRLLFFLGAAALGTLYAIVRAIFTRVRESEPGRQLTRQEAPALWQVAEQVAQQVGTRPVDHIYIVPGTQMAVTEQGGMLSKLRDKGKRMLILGMAVLDGMTEDQFKAILAHEYGHFSGRDTAGGNVAYRVELSMKHMAMRLVAERQARWYNPAWWFVQGYYRIFLRITQGASRLQEILADRVAATAYGCQHLIDGLEHVIQSSIEFDAQANAEVRLALSEQRGLNNLYALPALPDEDQAAVEEALKRELARESSAYDSHPSYRERVDCLESLNLPASSAVPSRPVTDLLPELGALQQEMTGVIEQNVARQFGRASLAQG